MKLAYSLSKTYFLAGLQYRGPALAGIITQFFWGLFTILLFQALGSLVMSPTDIAAYFWLRQSFLAMCALWMGDNHIFTSIENGDIAYELLRPVNLYKLWFFRNMGYRLARVLLRFAPILLIASLLPEPLRLEPAESPAFFAAFLISLVLTMFLQIALNNLIYILTIYTKKSQGIRLIFIGIFETFDGSSIPHPFFPDWMQAFLRYSFFFSIQSAPFLLYIGQADILSSLALQVFWLLVFVLLGLYLMKRAYRYLESFGA